MYGGRDLGIPEWLIFEEEYYHSGAPGRVNTNGINLLAPALFDFGTDEQKNRFLQAMAAGEEIWAQGWSEPDAGSDLASIKTKAQKDDEWFVRSSNEPKVRQAPCTYQRFLLVFPDAS